MIKFFSMWFAFYDTISEHLGSLRCWFMGFFQWHYIWPNAKFNHEINNSTTKLYSFVMKLVDVFSAVGPRLLLYIWNKNPNCNTSFLQYVFTSNVNVCCTILGCVIHVWFGSSLLPLQLLPMVSTVFHISKRKSTLGVQPNEDDVTWWYSLKRVVIVVTCGKHTWPQKLIPSYALTALIAKK